MVLWSLFVKTCSWQLKKKVLWGGTSEAPLSSGYLAHCLHLFFTSTCTVFILVSVKCRPTFCRVKETSVAKCWWVSHLCYCMYICAFTWTPSCVALTLHHQDRILCPKSRIRMTVLTLSILTPFSHLNHHLCSFALAFGMTACPHGCLNFF